MSPCLQDIRKWTGLGSKTRSRGDRCLATQALARCWNTKCLTLVLHFNMKKCTKKAKITKCRRDFLLLTSLANIGLGNLIRRAFRMFLSLDGEMQEIQRQSYLAISMHEICFIWKAAKDTGNFTVFIDLILSAAPWLWGGLWFQKKWVPGIFPTG